MGGYLMTMAEADAKASNFHHFCFGEILLQGPTQSKHQRNTSRRDSPTLRSRPCRRACREVLRPPTPQPYRHDRFSCCLMRQKKEFDTATALVEVPFHYMHVGADPFEVLECLTAAEVPSAKYVLDLSRHQQVLELGRQVHRSRGNMQVSNHQRQLHQHINAFVHKTTSQYPVTKPTWAATSLVEEKGKNLAWLLRLALL